MSIFRKIIPDVKLSLLRNRAPQKIKGKLTEIAE